MNKAETRKLARLEAENAELREMLRRTQSIDMDIIREACAYRVMVGEITAAIEDAKEWAR